MRITKLDYIIVLFYPREESQAKLEALKIKGKQDISTHVQDIKELQRKLDHDSKLEEFLGVKGQKRVMADLEAKEALIKRKYFFFKLISFLYE